MAVCRTSWPHVPRWACRWPSTSYPPLLESRCRCSCQSRSGGTLRPAMKFIICWIDVVRRVVLRTDCDLRRNGSGLRDCRCSIKRRDTSISYNERSNDGCRKGFSYSHGLFRSRLSVQLGCTPMPISLKSRVELSFSPVGGGILKEVFCNKARQIYRNGGMEIGQESDRRGVLVQYRNTAR
jgi:hypothetical protein